MRRDIFEETRPVCPRCLHLAQRISPLKIGEIAQERGEDIWFGTLHCSDPSCWLEFPIIDGVPIITADPGRVVENAQGHILSRSDLPPVLSGVMADALGPSGDYDTTRQHLSLYAESHFADWTNIPRDDGLARILTTGLDLLEHFPEGPVIDCGGSVGRGGWEASRATGRTAIVADLNFAMLRLGKRLQVDGQARFDLRRVGVVYDPIDVVLPERYQSTRLDFWAIDITALPFAAGTFGVATAINVLDCVPSATGVIAEIARCLTDKGAALFTTPYDWSPSVTPMEHWLGGHSQRTPHAGRSEPVLRATLAEHGFDIGAERDGIPWKLRLHDRSVMHYDLHMLACYKT